MVVSVDAVSAVPCGVFKGACIALSGLVARLIVSMKYMTVSVRSSVSDAKSGRPFYRSIVSIPFVDKLESASGAWGFILAR